MAEVIQTQRNLAHANSRRAPVSESRQYRPTAAANPNHMATPSEAVGGGVAWTPRTKFREGLRTSLQTLQTNV